MRELLQTGADVNASEGPPWWRMAGTLVMPFILCCAFGSPQHYSKTALHVAMIQGDPELVKLLLADPSATYCCLLELLCLLLLEGDVVGLPVGLDGQP